MDREKNFGLGKGFFELISYGSLLRLAFFALCFFVVVFSMTSCIVGATGTIQECGGSNQPCCGGSGGLCWQGSCGAGGICGFNCGGLNQYCCSDSIIFPRGSYGGSFYCGDGNVCWNWLLDFRWRYWLPICLGC